MRILIKQKKIPNSKNMSSGTENKFEAPYQGPFTILQVYDNGTVCLKMKSLSTKYLLNLNDC